MSSPSSDPHTTPESAQAFITGIYLYCDAWCERCPLQHRCRQRYEEVTYGTLLETDHAALDRWLLEGDWNDCVCDEEIDSLSPVERAAYLAILEREDPPLTEEEFDRVDALWNQKSVRQGTHALTRAAAEYALVVRDAMSELAERVLPAEEPRIDLAFETVVRHAGRIAAKARRAAGGLVGGLFGDEREEDLRGVQSDANGCAKLLRLLIAESRDGWNLLSGDEQTAALEPEMLGRLGDLEDLVQQYFPRAMEFVRPGFDQEGR